MSVKIKNMYDVKETDFFDLEDEAFDTVIEPGIKFTGSIKFVKPFIGQKIYVSKRNMIMPKIEKAKNENGDWI